MPQSRITIHDHTAESNLFMRRSLVAFIAVVIMIGILITNLYHLQVQLHDTYKTRSNDNRIKVLPIAPNRGLIYDRNGILLAENRPSYALEIVPEKIKDMDKLLDELATIIDISADHREDFLKDVRHNRRFKSIALKSNLNPKEVAEFSVNQHKFDGVSIEARLTRHYPHADDLTHVLGYVGKINKKDLQKLDEEGKKANYAATRDIGKLGLEKHYEEKLHGVVGFREVEINSHGRVLRTLKVEPSQPGEDLYLSLDLTLQQQAKEALKDHRGAIVAMDPRNGEVLALYSNPGYDPNLFVHGISHANYSKLRDSRDRPLINRATQGYYPPASTVKPFIALLGLEKDVINEKIKIHDPGFYRIPGVKRKYRDWKKWGHGLVDVSKAIEQSCDTYFYDLAYKLGIDDISDFMAKFNFGETTRIDIDEEYAAILPSRGWKRARFNQPWYAGDTIAVGIGQSYWTATPMQIAYATSVLAMKGIRHTPHLVSSFSRAGEETRWQDEDLPPVQINNERNWDIVLDAMRRVVSHGSARLAFKGSNYLAAGKTGTAQVVSLAEDEEYNAEEMDERHRDNAMYIGFAPYDDPQFVVAVAIENVAKGGGGTNAAPVARTLMDHFFEKNPVKPRLQKDSIEKKTGAIQVSLNLDEDELHAGHDHASHQ